MSVSSLDAMKIIRKHQKSAPVLTVPIAKAFGLKVYRVPDWPDTTWGMIVRDPKRGGASGFAVYVNGKHSEVRRRAAIAHEVAHFVLHKELIGDGITEDAQHRSGLGEMIEREANAWAAEILMPERLVRDYVAKDLHGLAQLASKFNVSEETMEFRLMNLGLLKEAA